ncbi:flavoprotein-like protein [Geopyxis carbonaria]|nr:flavoprotein-like protein [Geopyxis carbonaria]
MDGLNQLCRSNAHNILPSTPDPRPPTPPFSGTATGRPRRRQIQQKPLSSDAAPPLSNDVPKKVDYSLIKAKKRRSNLPPVEIPKRPAAADAADAAEDPSVFRPALTTLPDSAVTEPTAQPRRPSITTITTITPITPITTTTALHRIRTMSTTTTAPQDTPITGGDLNNDSALRWVAPPPPPPASTPTSLALPAHLDDPSVRAKYRPFLAGADINDWITPLELGTVLHLAASDLAASGGNRIKVLVLTGSLRARSYSRLLAYEVCRLLHRLGCDVRLFDPAPLPVKDDVQHTHPAVVELRELSRWSDAHFWISPEQHGAITGVFKNQIDWIPLSTGSVRPTQGRTLAVAQVNGGSQSFNAVNTLRLLGRWMRMFVVPNQSSVPKAYEAFTGEEEGSRMKPGGNRDRVVDVCEELVKVTIMVRPQFGVLGDRFSERREREVKAEKARVKAEEEARVAAEEAKAVEAKEGEVVEEEGVQKEAPVVEVREAAAAAVNGVAVGKM